MKAPEIKSGKRGKEREGKGEERGGKGRKGREGT